MCNRYGPWLKLKLKLFGPVARELFGSLGDLHFTVALVQRTEVSARVIRKRKENLVQLLHYTVPAYSE